MVRNKRQALSQNLTPSPPPHPPVRNIAMEEAVAKLLEQNSHINNKLEMLCGLLPKVEEISTKIQSLATENAALRQDIAARDAKIDQLTSHVNKLDQASRATSLRILGLPITSATPSSAVPEIAYKEVIVPCIEAAIANGDFSAQLSAFPLHLIVSNAFALPAKKDQPSCPVILKLSSELIRNIIFRYKKDALPKFTDLTTHRVRNRYSVFEDLSPSNHAILRSFSDDPRVKSAWTYSGQVRFKTHEGETIYKVKNTTDTFDSIVVRPAPPSASGT
jgi:outer membrane murein-binding lipoprotein Lpp